MTNPERLLQFHFGSIDDRSRLAIERDLLEDPEALLDYLELKRGLEAAQALPAGPPARLWGRLSARVGRRRATVLAVSFGLALAASLLLCLFLFSGAHPRKAETSRGILIDAPHEPSADSGVL